MAFNKHEADYGEIGCITTHAAKHRRCGRSRRGGSNYLLHVGLHTWTPFTILLSEIDLKWKVG